MPRAVLEKYQAHDKLHKRRPIQPLGYRTFQFECYKWVGFDIVAEDAVGGRFSKGEGLNKVTAVFLRKSGGYPLIGEGFIVEVA